MYRNPFSNSLLFASPVEGSKQGFTALYFYAQPGSTHGIVLSTGFSTNTNFNAITQKFKAVKTGLDRCGFLEFENYWRELDTLSDRLIYSALNSTAVNDFDPGAHDCYSRGDFPAEFTFFLKSYHPGGHNQSSFEGIYYPNHTLSVTSLTSANNKVREYGAVSEI